MKDLPRYLLPGRGPDADLRSLLRPVPPLVLDAAGEEGAKHSALAERYGEANAAAIATRAKLADAERSDEDAAREAIEKGVAIPKSKADAVRAARRKRARAPSATEPSVPESARRLLIAAAPHAATVAENAAERATQLRVAGARRARRRPRDLRHGNNLRAEAAWSKRLAEDGIVPPWSSTTAPSAAERVVAEATQAIEEERSRRAERLAAIEREKIAANAVHTPDGDYRMLPRAPGTVEWDAAKGEAVVIKQQHATADSG